MTTSEETLDGILANDNPGGGGIYLSSSYDSRLGTWFGGFFTGKYYTRGQKQRNGEPVMWETGPKTGQQRQEVIFELYCPDEPRDPNNPLDDGVRLLQIKLQDDHIPDSEYSALLTALDKAGVGFSIRRGGRLMMLHERNYQGEKNRRKAWRAHYDVPTPEAVAMLDNLQPAGTTVEAIKPSASAQASVSSPPVSSGPPAPNYGTPQTVAPFTAPTAPVVTNGQYQQPNHTPVSPPAPTGPGEPPVPGAQHNGEGWFVLNEAKTAWVPWTPPSLPTPTQTPALPPLPPPGQPVSSGSPFITPPAPNTPAEVQQAAAQVAASDQGPPF